MYIVEQYYSIDKEYSMPRKRRIDLKKKEIQFLVFDILVR
jgi:hypothetical protein